MNLLDMQFHRIENVVMVLIPSYSHLSNGLLNPGPLPRSTRSMAHVLRAGQVAMAWQGSALLFNLVFDFSYSPFLEHYMEEYRISRCAIPCKCFGNRRGNFGLIL
jgi:hypothetical protein